MSEMNRRTLVKGAAIGTAAAAVPAAAAAVPGATAAAVKSGRAKRVDVAVVGAGMAGLYAADLLRKAGKSVVVLEASHRVGGRVHNLTVGPERNDIAEAGAEWIAPSQPHMQKLVKRFGLKTYKNYTKGKSTLIIDGKVSRFDGATIPDLPNGGTKQLIKAFGELTKMAKEVPVDAPWKAPNALEWDQQTGQTWIDANISDPVARDFAGIAIGGPASVAPGDISLLHYLFIAQASGGPLSLVSIGSGDLSDRIKGGTGRLVEGLAKTLRHHIHLKTPVTMIERSPSKVRLTTPNGAWVANDAILAMSPTITQQILFDPALPVHREQSVQRTGNGSCVKCFPVYSKPFWRDQGLNGIIQSNSTPFSGVFDNSPPDGSIGVLFALVENKHARRFARISPAERKAKVLDGLALALGPKARNPIRWREYDWDTQPWLRGGACSFFAPGVLTEYRYLFDKPIGRLHFAGTETGRDFWGNMESAAASGERAVGEILG